MKRFISSLLVASMLSVAAPSRADEPVPPVAVVSPVSKGQAAPFSGVLFSPEAVAKVVIERQMAVERQQLAVQKQADTDAATCNFQVDTQAATCKADKQIMQAQLDSSKQQVKFLNEQLQKSLNAPNTTFWMNFGIGAASGILVTVLTVAVVSEITN